MSPLNKRIILTVPHGCLPTTEVCDTKADLIASHTFELLHQEDFPFPLEVYLFINRTPRQIIDMNRPAGRGTSFRDRIDETIEDGHNVLLFDIHSFPEGSFGKQPFEVGVFNLPKKSDDQFVKQVNTALKKVGFSTQIIDGSSLNDIAECPICNPTDRTVLLEFNRDLDIEKTAVRLANTIKQIIQQEE